MPVSRAEFQIYNLCLRYISLFRRHKFEIIDLKLSYYLFAVLNVDVALLYILDSLSVEIEDC